jgi:pimeloyl-ACP methyl ester carboxylesterase
LQSPAPATIIIALTAAASHPDCRAVLTQIVALYAKESPAQKQAKKRRQRLVDAHEVKDCVFLNLRRLIPVAGNFIFTGLRGAEPNAGIAKVLMPVARASALTADERLVGARLWPADNGLSQLSDLIDQSGGETIIYVHGFWTSFASAAVRLLELNEALHYGGLPILLSWPSTANFWDYVADVENASWSTTFITNWLDTILGLAATKKAHVITHSMGVRPAIGALASIGSKRADYRLEKVQNAIFGAPDVDRDIFERKMLPLTGSHKLNTTIYVSRSDIAMRVSAILNGYPRVGSTQDGIYIAPLIDTIDVTELDTSAFYHSAPFEVRAVISDMYYIIAENLRPHQRHGLRPVDTARGRHWKFRV